jgi:hypothetical protein
MQAPQRPGELAPVLRSEDAGLRLLLGQSGAGQDALPLRIGSH